MTSLWKPHIAPSVEKWRRQRTSTICRLGDGSRALHHVRYHESMDNLTPADVYFVTAGTSRAERKRIKLDSLFAHDTDATFLC